MEITALIIITEIVILVILFFLFQKYPILYIPFDKGYQEFKNVYMKYQYVLNDTKTYHVFVEDLKAHYKYILEKTKNVSYEKYKIANTILSIIDDRPDIIEKYFSQKFTYNYYFAMLKEYDLTEKEKQEELRRVKTNAVPLLRKVLIFESLFRAAGVNVDTTQKARFIRNLLEIELETEKIANTNIYKQLKKVKNAPETEKECQARADDLEYVANELEYIDLQKERNKLINEIKGYKGLI